MYRFLSTSILEPDLEVREAPVPGKYRTTYIISSAVQYSTGYQNDHFCIPSSEVTGHLCNSVYYGYLYTWSRWPHLCYYLYLIMTICHVIKLPDPHTRLINFPTEGSSHFINENIHSGDNNVLFCFFLR